MTIIPLFKDLFVCTVAYSDKGLYWPCAEKTATHVLQGLDKINMILPKACNNVVPGGILLFLHAENNSLIYKLNDYLNIQKSWPITTPSRCYKYFCIENAPRGLSPIFYLSDATRVLPRCLSVSLISICYFVICWNVMYFTLLYCNANLMTFTEDKFLLGG